MDEQTKILYREILERYNKIIWTHKINLCQMDIYLTEKKRQNFILSIFSVLVSHQPLLIYLNGCQKI